MGRRVRGAGAGQAIPIAVLKFGSSVLAGADGFHAAAAEVAREVDLGRRVLAVVSAPPGATDMLLASATSLGGAPPDELVSRLLAGGEATSVALLAIALAVRGIPARCLDPVELGVRTRGPRLDADPDHVDVRRLLARFRGLRVLVAPGFVGVGRGGGLALLGRGGSDLTALFLADRLDAVECRLVKDVDGVHARDPRVDPEAPVFRSASWEVVLEVGGALVQEKAVRFARERRRSFRVACAGGVGTWVGTGATGPPELSSGRRCAARVGAR